MPDDFLRRWDPLTVFFDRDVGPESAGPEDQPADFVRIEPTHPVEGRWLDRRTLQIRPVDPWPALERFRVTVQRGRSEATFRLNTLMAAPTRTWPANLSKGLEQVNDLTLQLEEPLDAQSLARALTLELRPLPGVGEGEARWLDSEDFDIKVLERGKRTDPARYVVALRRPLPQAHRARLFMLLSLDTVAGRPSGRVQVLELTTAEPFRVTSFGCADATYPVTPGGSVYGREQALRCQGAREAKVTFSAKPQALGALEARNLMRLSPSVPGFGFSVSGNTLTVTGDFEVETPYRLSLEDSGLEDHQGRALELGERNEVWIYFPRRPSYLMWRAGRGWLERQGPQAAPIEGRGDERLDLRVHRVDPLDRNFWPFPDASVVSDDDVRPPGPGEVPPPFLEKYRWQTQGELAGRLKTLGSPPVSTWVDLPLQSGKAASFGLDLKGALSSAFGDDHPGSYLVGIRRLDGSSQRSWTRLQVTDLALTTFEEAERVVFFVSSLSTAEPVAGARVRVDGAKGSSQGDFQTLFAGTTDPLGRLIWDVSSIGDEDASVRRILVSQGDDFLALDPTRPPDSFHNGAWTKSQETWLQWTQGDISYRTPEAEYLAHVFSERPVYRPEEKVHLKAYVRSRFVGRLQPMTGSGEWEITGPGGREWLKQSDLTARGSTYLLFDEEDTPSGVYRAILRVDNWTVGSVTFRKEAYRLPRFEVLLSSAHDESGQRLESARLDEPFEVRLTADYYAGGRVTRRPIRWRVTQFPYTWQPKSRPGFVFSSDGRFSRTGPFESSPALDKEDVTDADGGAVLRIDPSVEPTAQPRTYVVEATVTGVDDQTVTATRRVVALPPFQLGLKTPRFLDRGEALQPEVWVIGPDDEPIAGQEVTLRLLHRQWHSHLRAGDFSDGVARYVTDVVDEKVFETLVESTLDPLAVDLPIREPGVYVVEIESRDRLGRTQSIAVDLYAAAGDEQPVAWERPSSPVFEVSTDKDKYQPGDVARLVLRSPFQNAGVMAVVEAPEGNTYELLKVEDGQAIFDLEIRGHWSPRLPVHFVLLRGRVEGTAPAPGRAMDLGKPTTLASIRWLEIEPLDMSLDVSLDFPAEAMPGREIEVEIRLAEPDGTPASGEVTLWLVDRAVLALGKEQRLDPIPDFLTPFTSILKVHDTRGLVFGAIPWVELPGGGEGASERGVLDRQTVRKNFQTVPFYDPNIWVGPDGTAVVKVPLPDNLTDFAVRAKATSGEQRFGSAKGRLSVRLPVIVQPALPRFVRPGDRFRAGAVARLISGSGGPGTAQAQVDGLEADAADLQSELSWLPDRPIKLEFPVRVTDIPLDDEGRPLRQEVVVRVGVERSTDQAGDAFEVRLPVRPDRRAEVERWIVDLAPGEEFLWPEVPEEVREGSLSRRLLVSDQPGIVRLAAGLDALLEYPYGCTEQRVSQARALMAMARFRDVLHMQEMTFTAHKLEGLLEWISQSTTSQGLVAYWPGGGGYVTLTGWVVHFLAEARDAGLTVPDKISAPLVRALEQALRSDYSHFVDGAAWSERVIALEALARWGRLDESYAAELGRKGDFLVTEDLGRLVLAMDRGGVLGKRPRLIADLWDSVIWNLHQGQEQYAGLRQEPGARNPLILPSETRSLATMTQALARTDRDAKRMPGLVAALVRLGQGDGWGSTQADASALLALAEVLDPDQRSQGEKSVLELKVDGGESRPVELSGAPFSLQLPGPAEALLRHSSGPKVAARAETRYLPASDGSMVESARQGLLIERGWSAYSGSQVDQAPRRSDLGSPTVQQLQIGDVVEERIRVVSSQILHFVAVHVPLAAGVEALNPRLATAPPEAEPEGKNTVEPTYVDFRDDHVAFYFDTLPKGSHELFFRTRAAFEGSFIQPPARAEMMYDFAVYGRTAGARVEIERAEGEK